MQYIPKTALNVTLGMHPQIKKMVADIIKLSKNHCRRVIHFMYFYFLDLAEQTLEPGVCNKQPFS